MKNTFKSHEFNKIDNLLKKIRNDFEDSNKSGYYIEVDKLRYVRLRSIFENIFFKNNKLNFIVKISLRRAVKLLWMITSWKVVKFSSNSDLIHIRNNLSVIYLDRSIRVKFFIDGGNRSLKNIKNEIEVRKKLQQNSQNLMVPELLNVINNGMIGYVERVIYGSTISWDQDSSDVLTRRILKIMLENYSSNKVSWCSVKIKFPDLYNYFSKSNNDSKVNSLLNKNIACSNIHGDLSLGNVIIDNKDDFYIIDWELSIFGPIVYDLFKIIMHKPFIIPALKFYLNEQLENNNQNIKNSATFDEQLTIARLIVDSRLLIDRDLENE